MTEFLVVATALFWPVVTILIIFLLIMLVRKK
jgi:hypothetical protein